jgi:CHASE3 domain sensor protein
MNHYTGREDVAERISRDLADLRAVTRQAHEAIKDLRTAIREAREVNDQIVATLATQTNEMISMAVNVGLDNYQSTMMQAIKEAEETISERFERIYEALVGSDKHGQREGFVPLDEIADAVLEKRQREGATE